MFHVHAWGLPYAATAAGVKQVYPGRYQPELLLNLIKTRGCDVLPLRPDDPANAAVAARQQGRRSCGLKMVIGGAALTKALAKAAMQRGIDIFCRLRHVGNRSHPDDRAAAGNMKLTGS